MKKLFFTALVAVVAVGGALSVNATTYYYPTAPNAPIACEGGDINCELHIEQTLGLSTVQTVQGSQASEISTDDIPDNLLFND